MESANTLVRKGDLQTFARHKVRYLRHPDMKPDVCGVLFELDCYSDVIFRSSEETWISHDRSDVFERDTKEMIRIWIKEMNRVQ